MELDSLLKKLDDNQLEIESHGSLDAEIQKRINYKFRLDWNYYSNSMEGNSLTRIETKQLMMDNVTIDGKPFKDIAEMRGHDSEVLEIFKIGKGELSIAESRIKKLHKAIMHEDDPEKSKMIGEWKSSDNYLLNYRGERIDFAPHGEVAEAIHTLLNVTNASIDKTRNNSKEALHPAIVAFYFHVEYLRIHPFYDGNGRTGRLLMNLILISLGYPPVILRLKEKETYYKLLSEIQGYGADPKEFYAFMCNLLIESQELIINAIAGESIEDEDDLDKEISLFKQSVFAKNATGTIKKSSRIIAKLCKSNLNDLFQLLEQKHNLFEELFAENTLVRLINDLPTGEYDGNYILDSMSEIVDELEIEIYTIELIVNQKAFQNDGLNLFDVYHQILIKFDDYQFHIADNYQNSWSYLYGNPPSTTEIGKIGNAMVKSHFNCIQSKILKED